MVVSYCVWVGLASAVASGSADLADNAGYRLGGFE